MQRSRFIRGAASTAALMAAFPLVGCGGGGAGDAGSPAPAPVPAAPPPAPTVRTFAYVANYSSGDISVFRLGEEGELDLVGTAHAGFGAASVVVHPSGRFAYVLNQEGTARISIYSIEGTTGMLSPVGNFESPNAGMMSIHPTGTLAVMFGSGPGIATCRIDSDTGALTAAGLVPTDAPPSAVAFDSEGAFLFAVGSDGNACSYVVNTTTPALSRVGLTATGQAPAAIAVVPSGKFLYVANGDGTISIISISPEGELADAGSGNPEGQLHWLVVDHLGEYAFVGGFYSVNDQVIAFRIDAETGTLTPAGRVEIHNADLGGLAIHPSGRVVYVINSATDTLAAYRIDRTSGALTEMAPSVLAGANPVSIAIVQIAQ